MTSKEEEQSGSGGNTQDQSTAQWLSGKTLVMKKVSDGKSITGAGTDDEDGSAGCMA